MKRSFDDLATAAIRAGESLGMIECAGIAEGFAVADRVLKAALVELLLCRPASPGKQLVLFAGAPSAVASALRAGIEGLATPPLDTLLLPNVDPAVIAALGGTGAAAGIDRVSAVGEGEAAGIIECSAVATLLIAADIAVKSAAVSLVQLRAAVGIGGKAYFICSGEIAQVRAAVNAAASFARERGRLVGEVVLTQPHSDLAPWLAGETSAGEPMTGDGLSGARRS